MFWIMTKPDLTGNMTRRGGLGLVVARTLDFSRAIIYIYNKKIYYCILKKKTISCSD
ncbi:hypothetical protein OIU77_000992 [Salix suchowensis]|uniref:Uncharacterized protein n=1 Tax=Salix suchowensis TaxID=1278906 RepID=A0ABQ9BA19_9ROSI|nr:hypothetical protein OIU77_000992 [Salix suchowensis]